MSSVVLLSAVQYSDLVICVLSTLSSIMVYHKDIVPCVLQWDLVIYPSCI